MTTATTDAVVEELWGEEAIAWWEAMGSAAAEGAEHMVLFLASDLVWEERVFGGLTHGEEDWLTSQYEDYGGLYPWIDTAFLVSADEILGRFGVPDPATGSMTHYLDRMAVGPQGVSRWLMVLSFTECRDRQPWVCEFDASELVDRYVKLWSGPSDVQVGAVYAPGSVISDTLLGRSSSGQDAIGRSVGSGVWPDIGQMVVTDLLAERPSPAVFVAVPGPWEAPLEITFLIDVDDGSGCPGLMGVALIIDETGKVSREHRYHDIDSVRRCYDAATLQPGWWDGMETPATMVVEPSGMVSYGDMEVAIFNGMPEVDGFVHWGLSQFEAAGLSVPIIDSVTFLQARAYCRTVGGLAERTPEGTSITLCATREDICLDEACREWAPRSQHFWLHELAHPWLHDHVNEAHRQAFLELVGLERWSAPDEPWRQRGVERAADTLAYGLMGAPVELVPKIHGDCATRDAGFRILTGRDPIAPCSDR